MFHAGQEQVDLINVVGLEEQSQCIWSLATVISMLFKLETMVSPHIRKSMMSGGGVLVVNSITQNNSIFRSQIIVKDLGDGMLPCGIQSWTDRHGSMAGYLGGILEEMPNNMKALGLSN